MFWGIPFIGWLILVAVTIACKENPSHDVFEFPDQVSYNLHVRPILSENCFTCHGPDANKREAGLRLDVASEAYAVLKDSPGKHAIVPGSSTESLVFNRMISLDPEEKMPPPSSNLQLSDHR